MIMKVKIPKIGTRRFIGIGVVIVVGIAFLLTRGGDDSSAEKS
ncbi:MAG: hypothetical protein RL391_478, partial [Actinomycetota bacterium]